MPTDLAPLRTTPIIDHHAHNLLLPSEIDAHDLLSITSEANGPALGQGAPSTLAHSRAVHQLSTILGCDSTWDAVRTAIEQKRQEPEDAWARRCFDGIQTVLIDDGLDAATIHPYEWHDRLTRSECKRIVRIEKVAEELLIDAHQVFSKLTLEQQLSYSHKVTAQFTQKIEEALSDPKVAGFKSVICYRVGLAIPEFDARGSDQIVALLQRRDLKSLSRLEHPQLSPYFVHLTAKLIGASGSKKPFQFHTGLGDNDIELALSNPSLLQTFIKTYLEVPIVLLHASYPFTTEATYLANVYSNCGLDIGEVFPFLSQDGQERLIREALDLCPSEKLTWSTDGHRFPETYLLAVLQVREGFMQVLREYVDRGALTVAEAITIVQDVFFKTSNKLYDLGLQLRPPETPLGLKRPTRSSNKEWDVKFSQLTTFLHKHSTTRYLRFQWLDYTATLRVRIIPTEQVLKRFVDGDLMTLTNVVFGLLQNEHIYNDFVPNDGYNLYPCFESLRLASRPGYATVQCEFRDIRKKDLSTCPRTCLRKQVESASGHGMTFLAGFEIEIVFMTTSIVDGDFQDGAVPIGNGGHAWSSARALQTDSTMDLLEAIHKNLERADIKVQQLHAESSPGQFEFVLDPLSPLAAVDASLAAREIISSVTANAGLRATLFPKPSTTHSGTGAHIHFSCVPASKWQEFYAGVIKHLRAIAAFTYSNEASCERVADRVWGREYVDSMGNSQSRSTTAEGGGLPF